MNSVVGRYLSSSLTFCWAVMTSLFFKIASSIPSYYTTRFVYTSTDLYRTRGSESIFSVTAVANDSSSRRRHTKQHRLLGVVLKVIEERVRRAMMTRISTSTTISTNDRHKELFSFLSEEPIIQELLEANTNLIPFAIDPHVRW